MKLTEENKEKMRAGRRRLKGYCYYCYRCKYYTHPMTYIGNKLVFDENYANDKPEPEQGGWWCNNPKSKFYNLQVDGDEKHPCWEKRVEPTP